MTAPAERADAARNRLRILDAARRLLASDGFADLSQDAVAKEAGVGVGTVHRRFHNRAGLVHALIEPPRRTTGCAPFCTAWPSSSKPTGSCCSRQGRARRQGAVTTPRFAGTTSRSPAWSWSSPPERTPPTWRI
ncbi:TetR/AcrR family transcriptional regulator [Streptomyces sp. NPDC057686]|uniref:TetR/AcrR family transcriptional regulator n=1 Tax=Streptomyces sp. NPDC057686 TaxID=3346212 RepID=UPI003676369B